MNDLNPNNLKLEGTLSKYTNVMRGYQYRYFVVDAAQGKLDYFMSEDMKTQRPRCSIQLQGAAISPSDEDSTTFMIYSSDNEMFKLRAQDAKERQHWVNVLRIIAQSYQENESPKSQTILITSHQSKTNIDLSKPNVLKERKQPEISDAELARTYITNIQLISEVLNQVRSSQSQIEKSISNLPCDESQISMLDKDILILKATSKACVSSLHECCNILNTKHKRKTISNYNIAQSTETTLNLPAKATNKSSRNSINEDSNHDQLEQSQKSTKSDTLRPDYSQKQNASSNPNSSPSTPNKFISHTAININHEDDEVTDDDENSDGNHNSENTPDYSQIFDDNKSLTLHVLSNLKLGMDLTKVTLPTFILDKRSLLEMFADCMTHTDLLLKIDSQKSAEERILATLEWYLSLFHQLRKDPITKKPYNPVIGETFHCSWKVPSSEPSASKSPSLVTYCSEQVSHHPPISAFYVECEEKKIKLNASVNTTSKYLGMSIGVSLVGRLVLKLGKHNEEYVMSLPSCHARSILTHPWIELGDKVSITCPQTGYSVSIVFQIKPFYGGSANQITAEVKNKSEEVICKVQGAWDGTLEYQYLNTKTSKSVDTLSLKMLKKRVRPIELQGETESRRVWRDVTQALTKGQIDTATNYRSILENHQRSEAKSRTENQTEFKPKYFIRSSKEHDWLHQNWLM